jgi:small subunit ribosomal protein S3
VGQKVHPFGFRLGFNKTWKSLWYADKDYAKLLHEDIQLKRTLKKRFSHAGVSKIETSRAANRLKIDIYTSRPGIIIGRKGTEVDKLKQELQKRTSREVFINIQEIQKPELDSQLIAESVAMQLEKRVAFRRAMRKAVESALRFGARGIKVRVSGRLNGSEIARSESCRCRRFARISITALLKRTRRTARSASRCGSTRVSGSCRSADAKRNTGNARRVVRRPAHREIASC